MHGRAMSVLTALPLLFQQLMRSLPWCRQEVAGLNSLIVGEGRASLAQQKAVWAGERQALLARWEQQRLSLQIQSEQAHLQDMHLLHLSNHSQYRSSGTLLRPLPDPGSSGGESL